MSRYGVFDVVRTERRICKKACDPNADSDGMREYSYLRCPHCRSEEIPIPTSALRNNKSLTISNHILTCPSFEGERPMSRIKRSKTSETRPIEDHEVEEVDRDDPGATIAKPPTEPPAVTPMLNPLTTLVPFERTDVPLHCKLNDDITEIRKRLTNTEVNLESTKAKLEQTEAKLETTEARLDTTLSIVGQHQLWWGDAAAALGYARPQDPPLLLEKIRELRRFPDDGLVEIKQNMTLLLNNNAKMIEQKDKMLDQNMLMIAQKDLVIEENRALQAQKDEIIEDYRRRLAEKEVELREAQQLFEAKDVEMREAQRTAQEALKAQTTAASRYERVRQEKETLRLKFDAEIKAKHEREKASRRHGSSLLYSLEQAQKRKMLASIPSPSMFKH